MADEPPPTWGQDSLTKFLDLARENQWATFARKKEAVGKLIALDQCFMRAQGHLSKQVELVPGMLLIRCHASYRAACQHAMAGQVVESYADTRVCLENAAYACRIGRDADLAKIWLRRHDDREANSTMQRAFRLPELKTAIREGNRKAGEIFEVLYQRSIDSGAHPNERATSGSLQINDLDGAREFLQIQLHGDGVQLDLGLKNVAQAGVCALEILQVVFNARFELLGISADLLKIRRGL